MITNNTLKSKSHPPYWLAGFAFAVCLSTGACSFFSLDSYEGTLTRFFPESVGKFQRFAEMTPIPSNTFIPEARALIRDGAYGFYGRNDTPGAQKRSVRIDAFGLRSPAQAVSFLQLYKDSLLKENYVLKEEGTKKTWFSKGERLVLTRSAENSPGGHAEMLIIWRNGAVLFAAQSSDDDHAQKIAEFESKYPY